MTSNLPPRTTSVPHPRLVGGEGFIPLTVALNLEPLETTTIYVRAERIATVLAPPAGAAAEADEELQPGAMVGLTGDEQSFSVLETPTDIFEIMEHVAVMKR